jgi:hypothetical protein
MKRDLERRQSFPPLITGVLAEIGYAAAIGAIGIFICAVVLLLSRVL